MSRVFLLGPTDHNIDDALRYGRLQIVFEGPRPSIFDHKRFSAEYCKRLRELNFDPDKDFVLLIGTAVPLILCTSFLLDEYGFFKALLFNAAKNCYVVRTLGDETD